MRLIYRIKAVEDAGFVLFRKPDARIRHGEHGRFPAREADSKFAAFLIVADGVGNEVVENFQKPLAAGHDPDAARDVEPQGEVLLRELRLERADRLAHEFGEVYLVIGELVAVDGGKIDDGTDEVGEAVALFDDGLCHAPDALGRDAARGDELGKAADTRERRVHFVRDVGDEIVLRAQRRHQFGDV